MDEAPDVAGAAQEGQTPPAVLRTVVICLTVLAILAPLSGMAGGLVVLANGDTSGGVGPLLVQVLGYFLSGWAGGAVLWAAAWLLRQQYDLAAVQRRILAALDGSYDAPHHTLLVQPAPVEADAGPQPAQAAAAPSPAAASEAPPGAGAADAQVLRRILDELEEIRSDLLLSAEQREARRREIEQRRTSAVVGRIEEALEAGQITEAQRLLGALAEAAPDDPRAADLHTRLAARMADDVEHALDAGDVALGEELLARLVAAYDMPDRVGMLRQRLAGGLVHEIDDLIDRKDLGGAAAKLEELAERYPDDPRCAQLRNRLSAARSTVQDKEVQQQRQRVQELMAVAAFDKAEAAAAELAARHPESEEAAGLQALVRREATAFRGERRARLFAEMQRFAESRQWRHAVEAARRLLEAHPDCPEAREVSAMMPTLEDNAKIEEVRELRDRIQDMVRRRRFAEAADLAREVIRRFPETQAAIQLRQQLPRLQQRAATGQGHNV
jgi:hypothetical protein